MDEIAKIFIVEAVIGKAIASRRGDEFAHAKNLKLLGDEGLIEVQACRQCDQIKWAFAKQRDDLESDGMRDDFKSFRNVSNLFTIILKR